MTKEVRLDDLCLLIVDCPHSTPEWTNSGYLVLRNQNIKGGRLDLSEPSFTTRHDFLHRIRRAKPSFGDIVITREAPMGEVCMIPPGLECCVGQRQVLLRPDPKLIDSRYLLFALQSAPVQHQISWSEGSGSTVSNLRIPHLKDLKIPYRPLRVQEAIASLLGALDDKIELNRRMNATLEAIVRATFRDWFVDFGPVRAKMEGRLPYLAPEIWPLFPGLLDSEGKPQGWKHRSIYEFADVVYGAPFASGLFNSARRGLPLIRIRDLTDHSPTIFTDEIHPKAQVIEPGDIVVGMDGEFRLHIWKGPTSLLNQRVCNFRPKAGIPKSFIAEALIEPLAEFERGKVGTTVIHLGKSDIDTFKLIRPDDQVLRMFDAISTPLINQAVANSLQSSALAETRDTLLPKLMSGEIRMKDAETIVEAAA